MKALFLYSPDGEKYTELVLQHALDGEVAPLPLYQALEYPDTHFKEVQHVIIAADMAGIKMVLQHAQNYGFSIGLLPLEKQKNLARCYALPAKTSQAIELALRTDPQPVDIVYCNDTAVLFRCVIGTLPLFDTFSGSGIYDFIRRRVREITTLRLVPFTITVDGAQSKKIVTAASGCMVLRSAALGMFCRQYSQKCSFEDGMVTALIVAPFSVFDYIGLMWHRLFSRWRSPYSNDSVGLIKSSAFTVESTKPLPIAIDGEQMGSTPATLRVSRSAVRLNHGFSQKEAQSPAPVSEEEIDVASLPTGKEINKAQNRRLPLFAYASEDRFKDLFSALREDAHLNASFIILMVLSTILATIGLFLNSASVIIGAMVLAPLMAPIISIAMSILRYERRLFRHSLIKIGVGILLALLTSFIITLISPYQPLTDEMSGRLNPTVLDLIVAVVAGIAGAYTKSFKEILQSLAGVAIAVALVPPLAVAGVGLGRYDLVFFSQAFLLFSTNLIGIILAATFTFLVLGYSPVVRDKKGIMAIAVFFLLITIPLTLTFKEVTERAEFEHGWQYERFLVNEKYLIVNAASLHEFHDHKLLILELHAREPLTRGDLNQFREKLRRNFGEDVLIRTEVVYIP